MRNDDSNASKVTDQYSSVGVKMAQLYARLLGGDLMMCLPRSPVTSFPQKTEEFSTQKKNQSLFKCKLENWAV